MPALRRTLGLGTLLPWNISARWCRACSCSSLMISLMVTVFLVIFFVMKDFCGYAETDVILLLPPGAVVVPVLPQFASAASPPRHLATSPPRRN